MPARKRSQAFPPLYVLRAGDRCPECGEATNVYALAASGLYDGVEDSVLPGFLLLTEVKAMPRKLLALLESRCPGWRQDGEGPDRAACLMNHCRRCGAALTDAYLHHEPGAAFFPTSAAECWNLSLSVVPWEEEVSLNCSWILSGLEEWLGPEQEAPW